MERGLGLAYFDKHDGLVAMGSRSVMINYLAKNNCLYGLGLLLMSHKWDSDSLLYPKPNLLIMLLVIELGLDKNVWLLEPVELCGEFNWGSCEIWIPKNQFKTGPVRTRIYLPSLSRMVKVLAELYWFNFSLIITFAIETCSCFPKITQRALSSDPWYSLSI